MHSEQRCGEEGAQQGRGGRVVQVALLPTVYSAFFSAFSITRSGSTSPVFFRKRTFLPSTSLRWVGGWVRQKEGGGSGLEERP